MKISPAQLDHFSRRIAERPEQALKELQESEATFGDDPTFWFNYAGFLIDGGRSVERGEVVKRGIGILESMVSKASKRASPNLLYNLANGYFALDDLARKQPGFHYDPDNHELLLAKRYYREALAQSDQIAPTLCSMVRVNYGNCLARLGRSVEAIDSYDLALQDLPDHAMALGNLAVELNRYANIARDPSLLVNARDLLRDALADNKLEETGLADARPIFERILSAIEERLTGIGHIHAHTHDQPRAEAASEHDVAYLQRYTAFCRQHHLFLNLCLRDRPCVRPAQDSVSLALVTALDDDTTFYRLSRIINEIKERYAVSRLLLFEASDPPVATQNFDALTFYTDNLDYGVYGVRVGKLKLAFEGAYNILDKIAFFANDYLALGIREKGVNFSSIWRESKGSTIRPALLKLANRHLFGLYDLSRDFAAGNYLNYLSDLRHYSTHRYLVPHVEAFGWRTEADAAAYHVGYHELFEKTLQLMQLTRSAITYLIAFIDAEERRKRRGLPGPSVPMFMPLARPYPIDPQDTGV